MEPAAVPNDFFSVTGKSIVITGASGALGAPAARALAAGGARLTIAGQNSAALDELVRDIEKSGGVAHAVYRRASTPEDAAAIVAAAVETHGGLDLLLVASGVNKNVQAVDVTLSDWDGVINANIKEPWLICQAAGRQMMGQKRPGKILLISSTRAKVGAPGFGPYCSSKAALNGMVRALAAEWGAHGITVNAIAPTLFRSPLTEWLFDDRGAAVRESVLRRIPLGRLAEPKDYVGPVLFMLSGASDFCTGQILYVDGGLTAT